MTEHMSKMAAFQFDITLLALRSSPEILTKGIARVRPSRENRAHSQPPQIQEEASWDQ
jgi:hypothetical protein